VSNVRVFSAVQTRRKLLLASTAIALAGYLYAPSVFAADECDPIVSNSVTCTSDGNDYASGIRYETADDLTMVVEDGVTIVTGAGEAIRIDFTGAGDLKLTLYDSDSLTDITTTENEAEGIYVRNAANVVITNEADIRSLISTPRPSPNSSITVARSKASPLLMAAPPWASMLRAARSKRVTSSTRLI
jgi:hypothetical protein